MKYPLKATIQITALVLLFVGAVFLGRSLPQPTRVAAAPLEPAAAGRPLMAPTMVPTWFSCGAINHTAVFSYPDPGRIYVQCANTPGAGVYWFAFKADDSAAASRMLSIFNTALATGKPLMVYYVDVDGSSWDCDYSNCRPIEGAQVGP
jgi:hypothetical protein